MSDLAIRAEGLTKRYTIASVGRRTPYKTLQEELLGVPRRLWAAVRGQSAGQDAFWALNDVSFEVKQGEVLGVVGRNGAGKSTLLKILARITEPTSGQAEIYGRVGSLLEVGTGFHAELTGRENIFLSGAVLGMTRQEVRSKFDEVVAFADVEKFIDTPAKHYSSGMYMRLAFAVAAHLEPEILLVDEVLAVGDAEFQKKCLGKMGEVAREGRTILFVSHNMDAVRRLCSRAMWLEHGSLVCHDSVAVCLARYLQQSVRTGGSVVFDPPQALANGMPVRLHAVSLQTREGQVQGLFSARSPICIRLDWETLAPVYKPRLGFLLRQFDGQDVLTSFDASSWARGWLPAGRRVSTCVLPGQLLNEGQYVIEVGGDSPVIDQPYSFEASRTGAILQFEVVDDMTLPNKYYGQEGFRDARWPGALLLDLPWEQAELTDVSAPGSPLAA